MSDRALELSPVRYYLSRMGPLTRRALHEALDHILDAMAADARNAEEKAENPRAKRKYVPRPPAPKLAECSPEAVAKARAALVRAGLT